jgi:hypothetical protein
MAKRSQHINNIIDRRLLIETGKTPWNLSYAFARVSKYLNVKMNVKLTEKQISGYYYGTFLRYYSTYGISDTNKSRVRGVKNIKRDLLNKPGTIPLRSKYNNLIEEDDKE